MNVWLCPVKPKNWRIIKSKKLFGVPKRGLKAFSCVKPGDILAFYVLGSIRGIVALGRINSKVFESHQDMWGKGRYPFRVKIEIMPEFAKNENDPIPLAAFFGKIDSKKGITIEPYLKNVWITNIPQEQYRRLKKLFQRTGKNELVWKRGGQCLDV